MGENSEHKKLAAYLNELAETWRRRADEFDDAASALEKLDVNLEMLIEDYEDAKNKIRDLVTPHSGKNSK